MTYNELCGLLSRAGYRLAAAAGPATGEIWVNEKKNATACVEHTPAELVGRRTRDGYPRPEILRVRFDSESGPKFFHWAAGGEGFAAMRNWLKCH